MLITFAAPRLNDPAQPNKWGVNVGGGRNNGNHGNGNLPPYLPSPPSPPPHPFTCLLLSI